MLPAHQPLNVAVNAAGCWQLPVLDLSAVKFGKSDAVKNLATNSDAVSEETAIKDAELCFEGGSILHDQIHPNALLQDSRCYVYKAVSSQEASALQDLLSRLPEDERSDVTRLWEALLVARRDCEMMAARGVRISRDISRDWQETVSDLIDRVLMQDKELGQLRAQLQAVQQPVPACDSTAVASVDELHTQLVRIRRQRDKLVRDQQEMSRLLLEAQNALKLAQHQADTAKEQLADVTAKASALREQHCTLLQDHIDVIRYSEQLEAAVQTAAPSFSRPAQLQQLPCGAPGGHSPRAASDGRRSPMFGLCAPGSSSASSMMQPAGHGSQAAHRQFGGLSVLPQALSSIIGSTPGIQGGSPRASSSTSKLNAMAAGGAAGRSEDSVINSPRGLDGCSLRGAQLAAAVAAKRILPASAKQCVIDSSTAGTTSTSRASDFPDTDRESVTDDQLTDASALTAPAAVLAGAAGKAGSRLYRVLHTSLAAAQQAAMQQLQAIAADRTCIVP